MIWDDMRDSQKISLFPSARWNDQRASPCSSRISLKLSFRSHDCILIMSEYWGGADCVIPWNLIYRVNASFEASQQDERRTGETVEWKVKGRSENKCMKNEKKKNCEKEKQKWRWILKRNDINGSAKNLFKNPDTHFLLSSNLFLFHFGSLKKIASPI